MHVDRAKVGDALLQGLVLVLESDSTTVLTLNFGSCATTEFFDMRSDFRGDVFSGLFDVSLRD